MDQGFERRLMYGAVQAGVSQNPDPIQGSSPFSSPPMASSSAKPASGGSGSPLPTRRNLTPINSPNKEKYGDRYIPSRMGNNWELAFHSMRDKDNNSPTRSRKAREASSDADRNGLTYNLLLRNELFGAGIEDLKEAQSPGVATTYIGGGGGGNNNANTGNNSPPNNDAAAAAAANQTNPPTVDRSRAPLQMMESPSKNLFTYRVSRRSIDSNDSSPYSLSPVGLKSQKLLRLDFRVEG